LDTGQIFFWATLVGLSQFWYWGISYGLIKLNSPLKILGRLVIAARRLEPADNSGIKHFQP